MKPNLDKVLINYYVKVGEFRRMDGPVFQLARQFRRLLSAILNPGLKPGAIEIELLLVISEAGRNNCPPV